MTEQASYGQFCPVAMAAEILCSRWTTLVIREMLCGTTRFNDLRRGGAADVALAFVEAAEGVGACGAGDVDLRRTAW